MICPKCKAEYVEGIKKCSDCHVNLVKTLEENQEVKEEKVDFIEIMRISSPMDAALIKSILEANEITYFIQGESFSAIYGGLFSVPMRVLVKNTEKDKAIEILKEGGWLNK